MKKKVYLAGPDVFLPDPAAWFEFVAKKCSEFGLEALVPYDPKSISCMEIFRNNLRMIDECDYILACVKPFRGTEPDSGTCWELGYGYAKGKPLVLYAVPHATVVKRTRDFFKAVGRAVLDLFPLGTRRLQHHLIESRDPAEQIFPDGYKAECFNLPLNLMLMMSMTSIQSDIFTALRAIADGAVVKTGEVEAS